MSELLKHLETEILELHHHGNYVLYDFVKNQFTTWNAGERDHYTLHNILADYERLFVATKQNTGSFFPAVLTMIAELERRGFNHTWIIDYDYTDDGKIHIRKIYDYVNHSVKYIFDGYVRGKMEQVQNSDNIARVMHNFLIQHDIFADDFGDKHLAIIKNIHNLDFENSGIIATKFGINSIILDSEEDFNLLRFTIDSSNIIFSIRIKDFKEFIDQKMVIPFGDVNIQEEIRQRYTSAEVKLI